MEVRCCRSFDALREWRSKINALNLASSRPDPFATFEFYENYWRNYDFSVDGRDPQLVFLLACEAGKLVGYAAFKSVTQKVCGMRARKLEYLVLHDSDRPHPVAQRGLEALVSQELFAYLAGLRPRWSLFELQQQDATSPMFPPPALPGRYAIRRWPNWDTHTIPTRWPHLRAYFGALQRKFRNNLRRQMRNLLNLGRVELLSSDDPDALPALFELYCAIEARSWKNQAGLSIVTNQNRTAYFRGLMTLDQPMRVSIQVLLCDGVPIAGLMNGEFDGTLYALHIVYDDRFSQYAPGSMLLLMGVRQAIARACVGFNLLGGFGYYKTNWLAVSTPTFNGQIYRPGSLFHWRRLLGDFKRCLQPQVAETVRFNESRRATLPAQRVRPGEDFSAMQDAAAVAAHAMLIAAVRSRKGEFLNSTQLAAALPFDVVESKNDPAAQTNTMPGGRRHEVASTHDEVRVSADA